MKALDLGLDRLVDERVLAGAPKAPDDAEPVRNVLLTGATGYLGRFLAVEWLQRVAGTGGQLTCLARAADDGRELPVVVSLTGVENDPQGLTTCATTLQSAGASVFLSNAQATRHALSLLAPASA